MSVSHQDLLVLAHLQCGDIYAWRAGRFGIDVATTYRYRRGVIDVLAAATPILAEAMKTVQAKTVVVLPRLNQRLERTP
ncbi:transposase family protein (plasmid) [Streptomyces sp. NBC_00525]|nr:hypothetical protein [Streptomyces sp. NBC_00525]WUC98139.1 transposase family protein [Streptomyces sp. NBC_00525]